VDQPSDGGRTNQRPDRAEVERDRLRAKWPDEYNDGVRCGYGKPPAGERLKGGYPVGFSSWELERRNAWWAGFNEGYVWRKREEARQNGARR
jgi:hypothetical protein